MRLGLDVGTNSIGWWLYKTSGGRITEVIDGGVRIFSDGRDPKSKKSLAEDRRSARSMRRRRDRYLRRRATLIRSLADAGLMPTTPREAKALELLDPYELRAKGLNEKLDLHQFGRALFHLNQRRGFKSNRKIDRGDNESGLIKDATARLDTAMIAENARTYGEFLHKRRKTAPDENSIPSVRTRLTHRDTDSDENEKMQYDFYPDRKHLDEEFCKLWEAQSSHHGSILTDELRKKIYEVIFFQRMLKPPEVGLCRFSGRHGISNDERRLPKAHPLTQRRILYETVNHLRILAPGKEARVLTLEQRDKIICALDNKKPGKISKSSKPPEIKLKALAKVIKLKNEEKFTLETTSRDAIACDAVRSCLSHPERLGTRWSKLRDAEQWEIVERIRSVESDSDYEDLVQWFQESHGLDCVRAKKTADSQNSLPPYYSNIGETATKKILNELKSEVITYSQAVERCGWHHSDSRTGEVLDRLPYYGEILERHVIPGSGNPEDDDVTRYGRVTNPTVHIGLNQLRRLVNKIIERYGKPDQIVVELARDLKMPPSRKKELEIQIRKNTDAAKIRSEKLAELGLPDTGDNRLLLRLYDELGPAVGPRCCPYTGTVISPTMVFSGACEVDHILPYSRTLDDSISNRTLCMREANREKGNQTPWEAWGNTDRWHIIDKNLENLNERKKWRFSPDSMKRFGDKDGFLDRALTDTQYLSRITRAYLEKLHSDGKQHVWVIPGRLTEMLRRHWGLNKLLSDMGNRPTKSKNRTDHRHHAIDAAVIAATDRNLLKQISKAAGKDHSKMSADDIASQIPIPWSNFRNDVSAHLERIVVSHRADHGGASRGGRVPGRDQTSGQLHNQTAHGIVSDEKVVSRIPLRSLERADLDDRESKRKVRDANLRALLHAATINVDSGKDFESAIKKFSESVGPYRGIRRVRVVENMPKKSRIEIKNGDRIHYKAYKSDSNYCYEIWKLPNGNFKEHIVSMYDAHTNSMSRPHPAAKRILRVFKRDTVALEIDGKVSYFYVCRFTRGIGLTLAEHFEANADARNRNKSDEFKFIYKSMNEAMRAKIRRLYVDEIGQFRNSS